MKVTGYQLREAIKRQVQRCEMAKDVFRGSYVGFDGEDKDPVAAGTMFYEAGTSVALLQAAQQRYNDRVTVTHKGEPITLAVAVKLIGHLGAYEKEWRTIASQKKERSYGSDPTLERDTTKIYAQRLISTATAFSLAEAAGKDAAQLRAAIATANNTELDIDLPETLFS